MPTSKGKSSNLVGKWEVWKWNGSYIKGELLGTFADKKKATKYAKKIIKYKKLDDISKMETILEDYDGNPIGALVAI
jgi:hypothetical protein